MKVLRPGRLIKWHLQVECNDCYALLAIFENDIYAHGTHREPTGEKWYNYYTDCCECGDRIDIREYDIDDSAREQINLRAKMTCYNW